MTLDLLTCTCRCAAKRMRTPALAGGARECSKWPVAHLSQVQVPGSTGEQFPPLRGDCFAPLAMTWLTNKQPRPQR